MESDEFDFILARAEGPVLAYFFGTWPKAVEVCKRMDAVVAEIAEEYEGRLTVVRADMARCPAPVRRYGVAAAPTFVLVRDGECVALESGALDRDGFGAFLEAHL
ncbi:thioredoxin family protein [Streptomyces sp. NPDC058657]|uniref:thioredoxin family protein n=1 Tax=unclassified Streptomyces TaxID=2593676 RepID=UPI0036635A71